MSVTNFQDIHMRIPMRDLKNGIGQELSVLNEAKRSDIELIKHVVMHHMFQDHRLTSDSCWQVFANRLHECDFNNPGILLHHAIDLLSGVMLPGFVDRSTILSRKVLPTRSRVEMPEHRLPSSRHSETQHPIGC
ncbi:hypothetical protein VTN77DRAFT_4670 [Rasamsonia byssochlamydoides]|uniref:uncharacterized protein n=1 Tax=Rasamsonia byssochlamydoides TaxID=89139 RepID=UPI0037428B96